MSAIVLSHLLAVYTVVAAPWIGLVWHRRARRRLQAGIPGAKIRIYHELAIEQVASTALLLTLSTRVPASSLGLSAPRSWPLTLAILLAVVVALVWSSLRLRRIADKIKRQLHDGIGILFPDTPQERSWFAAVSVGAGISEELAFRGFLLYYFALYLPQLNAIEQGLLTALFFGLGHLYQGWKGVVGTGILGLIFVGLYLLTGSLVLPMAVHAAVDLRLLLILPSEPQPRPVELRA